MQYRSGLNPSEPTNNNTSSRCWIFIIRNSEFRITPFAFQPHANYCCWLSYPPTRGGRIFIRGVLQFNSTRNYYTLKTRYSKAAEWIPKTPSDIRALAPIMTDPIYGAAQRHSFGTPLVNNYSPTPTVNLHKVGFNIEVPDLIEDFQNSLWTAHIEQSGIIETYPTEEEEAADEEAARKYEEYLDRVQNADFIILNPITGEEVGGRQSGHYWNVQYQGNKKHIIDS